MVSRRRGWRPWLAAAVSAGLAGSGMLILGGDEISPAVNPGLADARPAAAQLTRPGQQVLPAALAVPGIARGSALEARRPSHRALDQDATGGQIQLPGTCTGSPSAQPDTVTAGQPDPGRSLPAWRALLESRWQQRLATLTRLALAYHDTADRLPTAHAASDPATAPQLRRLMRETVAARRALSDTEEALARLSAGRFGRCEQCAAAIPATQLVQAPETRYCVSCTQFPAEPGHPAALTASAR
jgi:RNA polymerase-binding transcription factor DksA